MHSVPTTTTHGTNFPIKSKSPPPPHNPTALPAVVTLRDPTGAAGPAGQGWQQELLCPAPVAKQNLGHVEVNRIFCHWLPQAFTAPGQSWRPGHLWEALVDSPGLLKVAGSCIMEVNRNTQATRCLALVNVDITSEIHTAELFYLFFPNSFKKKKNNPRKMVSWAKVRRALS